LKVYCGSYHTFLVHESNKIFAFGLNNYGQLGVGTCDQYDLPHIVEGLPEGVNITKACGGEHHSMVLTSEGSFFSNIGKVYVFGRGDSGQLGLESSKLHLALEGAVNLPVGSGKVTSISCGGSFSLAVTDEDGNNLYMWGYGEMGQLSNGCVDAEEPFCVELKGRKVIEAAGGGQHSILLIQPK
jgi:regulator of chromosome condensation